MQGPGAPWLGAFKNIGDQGAQFKGRISPSNRYVSYLSSCEQDEKTNLYYVMFEVLPYEWFMNAYGGKSDIRALPVPDSPVSLYMIEGITEDDLLRALQLKSADDIAAGSWYLLELRSGTGKFNGRLVDGEFDKVTKG